MKSLIHIEKNGCRIINWSVNQQCILWSGKRPDGKMASTHPCLPNFGDIHSGLLASLPQHGPARNQLWQIIDQQDQNMLMLKPGGEKKFSWQMSEIPGVYSAGLNVVRTIQLTEIGEFKLKMELTNMGKDALWINPGEHCYFAVPYAQRNQIRINGAQVVDQWPETVYLDINIENQLDLPKIGRINMKLSGFNKVACWSQPGAEFVCIEPIAGEPNSIYDQKLQPGEKQVFSVYLTKKL